ncbi:hypothetical protein DI09_26p170 [Mitosporidium daphniae]|uniref:Uncharacterized protein n=1 Tax=Mitosporidium daphniae TaxID=1485682 RepID=A0A098VS50_9MICR|nr:uncharacterized protein DI09_26p170 [Mitosporidium daphniae]KGG51817.1 hypothetical protein DI09_26p170 [Mitosporidium daphniae]|eukprot:XP_013238244.1 uncharacterized protein DI09_26p170 [Mitosporidium daphniae]
MAIRLFSTPTQQSLSANAGPSMHLNTVDSGKSSTASDLAFGGIAPWLITTLASLGIKTPTEVQTACIPAILGGHDVIASSRTGSGKTAAFALPVLTLLSQDPFGIFALVLSPTRELVLQIGEQFKAFGEGLKLGVSIVIGGLDMMQQAMSLANDRPHIVIATPGRLADLLRSSPDLKRAFSRLKFLIFDEADRLLGEECFHSPVAEIISASSEKRQNLFFSATLPRSIVDNIRLMLPKKEPFIYNCKESYEGIASLVQRCVIIPSQVKDSYLVHLLTTGPFASTPSIIIFVGKCKSTALHSRMSQKERIGSLIRFKGEVVPILITTDLSSRGLDIPAVQLVINYDVPADPRTYIHRIGRTARAGKGGQSITFIGEIDVALFKAIEDEMKKNSTFTSITPLDEEFIKESEVLSLLNPVSKAKRMASMALLDSGFGERERRRKQREP